MDWVYIFYAMQQLNGMSDILSQESALVKLDINIVSWNGI